MLDNPLGRTDRIDNLVVFFIVSLHVFESNSYVLALIGRNPGFVLLVEQASMFKDDVHELDIACGFELRPVELPYARGQAVTFVSMVRAIQLDLISLDGKIKG